VRGKLGVKRGQSVRAIKCGATNCEPNKLLSGN